ncbi:hypothetical protein H4R22_002839 [Coemansia sp. RSA 1290]|nr:hypothetical protein H4R22_002839 [Coemansia sp. RSA 1290]
MAYHSKTIIQPEVAEAILAALKMGIKAENDRSIEKQLDTLDGAELLLCLGQKNESGLVRYFGELFSLVKDAIAEVSERSSNQWAENISKYEGLEHQTKPITGGKHKIDFAIHYSSHSKMDLASVHLPVEAKSETHSNLSIDCFGQLADYGYALWTSQPTRLFAPVLYLHGCEIRLLIFTRGGCRWVDLGQYCFANNSTVVSAITDEDVIRQNDNPSVDIAKGKKFERPINPRGRFAHVYSLIYRRRPAVLKLSWTPTNRLPECAVYDALTRAKVEHIPNVIDSGLICEDSFGYRVEFLLIQDCGVSLAQYLKRRSSNSIEDQCNTVTSAMLDVTTCLKQAWAAGIIHRDISAGNIAIRNGCTTVIDWGYAKIIDTGSGLISDLAEKWRFDVDQVVDNEDTHDPITGTPLYMSIPVLVGATKRSVVDDIESALYVVLDAVREVQAVAPKPIGFDFKNNRTLAFVRACCFSLIKECLPQFGIYWHSSTFDRLLTVVHKFLFIRDGYIGSSLAMVPSFKRTVDDTALDNLLSEIEELLPGRSDKQRDTGPIGSTIAGVKRVEISDPESVKGQTSNLKRIRESKENIRPAGGSTNFGSE